MIANYLNLKSNNISQFFFKFSDPAFDNFVDLDHRSTPGRAVWPRFGRWSTFDPRRRETIATIIEFDFRVQHRIRVSRWPWKLHSSTSGFTFIKLNFQIYKSHIRTFDMFIKLESMKFLFTHLINILRMLFDFNFSFSNPMIRKPFDSKKTLYTSYLRYEM